MLGRRKTIAGGENGRMALLLREKREKENNRDP